jgi:CBS domain-containing protein
MQPVCNEEGNVVGLLDITKVFHEALGKVERSSSASEKLYSALAGVQSELGPNMATNPQAAAMLAYVDALREKTALPDLTTVMDSRTQPATVGPKTTVKEVAKIMKERRTTAVCVMEGSTTTATGAAGPAPRIAGIFTSKDVVLRVIAAGLDAGRCSVVRVMTPHPDTAPPTMSVHDALKKMHSGFFFGFLVWILAVRCCRRTLSQFARGRNRRPSRCYRGCAQTNIRNPRAGRSVSATFCIC